MGGWNSSSSLDISINESSLDSGAFVVGALIVGISTLCVLSWSMCGALAGTQGCRELSTLYRIRAVIGCDVRGQVCILIRMVSQ